MNRIWIILLLLFGACNFTANPIKDSDAIDLAVLHLIDHQEKNGQFLNHANLNGDSLLTDNYPVLRHAETLLALHQSKEHSTVNQQKIDRSIQRGLTYLQSQLEQDDDICLFLVKNKLDQSVPQRKLLDQVLGLSVFLNLKSSYQINDSLIHKLYKGLLTFKDSSGNFLRFSRTNQEDIFEHKQTALNSTALLALTQYFNEYPSFDVKQQILPLLLRELNKVEQSTYHWDMRFMQSIKELLTADFRFSEFRDTLVRAQEIMLNRALKNQIIKPGSPFHGSFDEKGRINHTTTRIVSATAVMGLVDVRNDSLMALFDRAESFIRTAQVRGSKYPGAFTKSSCEIPGATMLEKRANYQIRLDYTSHALKALCAIDAVKQKRSSTEVNDL